MPFEIPESWEWVRLEDIATIGTGATPSSKNKDYYNGDIPWITSSSTNTEYIISPTAYITEKAILETNCRVYKAGTIIMAMYGEGKTRGQTSELMIDAATNQACAAIAPLVLSMKDYIKLYLKYSYWTIRFMAGGGVQPNLNLSIIAQYNVPLPPIEEQQRIASEVEKWFCLIDSIETNIQDLREIVMQSKSKILELAIHGVLMPQDPKDEPAIELLKRINPSIVPCDNPRYAKVPFRIPDSWEWVRLNDIAKVELGKTLDKGKNTGKPYNYLCAINVKWGAFDFATLKQFLLEDNERERYLVRKGDLLICEGGDVGRAAVWESDDEVYYQNALHRVRFKGGINQYFFLYVLLCYKRLGLIDDVSGGVTIKHFTQHSMKKLLFPLPPIAEQKRISDKITELFSLLDSVLENT